MSIVAKSLKRLKENKKPHFSISSTKKSDFAIRSYAGFVYGISIIAFFVIIFIYGYSTALRVRKQLNNSKFPSIAQLKKELQTKTAEAINVKLQPKGLENLLILKRFDEMFKLAKKENNLKYEGVYYFQKGNLQKAYKLLNNYLSKHKKDYEAKTYLAFVLYKQNNLNKALSLLETIKTKNCSLMFDKAAVYESLGKYHRALSLYRSSYDNCDNPIIKNKAKKKIIVLEYFLRNNNES